MFELFTNKQTANDLGFAVCINNAKNERKNEEEEEVVKYFNGI